MPAKKIYQGINLKLVRQWSVGEQRQTPKGNILEGKYKETYCCFELNESSSEDIAAALGFANQELMRSHELVEEITRTYGRIEFYISLSKGQGFELESSVVSEISVLKASLSVESF